MSLNYKSESTNTKTVRTLSIGWQAFAAVVAIAAVLTVAVVVQTLVSNERTRRLNVRGTSDGITVQATLAKPNHHNEAVPPKEAKRP